MLTMFIPIYQKKKKKTMFIETIHTKHLRQVVLNQLEGQSNTDTWTRSPPDERMSLKIWDSLINYR